MRVESTKGANGAYAIDSGGRWHGYCDVEQNEVGLEYYLFGKKDLFSIECNVRNNPGDIFHANMQYHFHFHLSHIFMLPSYAHISGHSSHGL